MKELAVKIFQEINEMIEKAKELQSQMQTAKSQDAQSDDENVSEQSKQEKGLGKSYLNSSKKVNVGYSNLRNI